MPTKFNFENLFIYDLANNHQGDLGYAKDIVREVGRVNREGKVKGALKFQFRQLDSFIHPDFKGTSDHKYVKRFSETRLEMDAFADLAKTGARRGPPHHVHALRRGIGRHHLRHGARHHQDRELLGRRPAAAREGGARQQADRDLDRGLAHRRDRQPRRISSKPSAPISR